MLKKFHIAKIASSYIVQIANLSIVLFFSIEEYAHFVVLMTFAGLIFALSSGVTHGALISLGTRDFLVKDSCNEIVLYRYVFIISSFVIFVIVGSLVNTITGYMDGVNLHQVLMLAFGLICYEAASQTLYPTSKVKLQAYYELALAIVLFIFIFFYVRDSKSYVYGYFTISTLAFLIAVYGYVASYGSTGLSINSDKVKEFLRYSSWQFVSVFSIYLLNYGVNFVLIYNKVGDDDISVVNFTLRLFFGMSAMFALVVILMPKIIGAQEIGKSISKINGIAFKVSLLLSGLYVAAAAVFYYGLLLLERVEYIPSVMYMLMLLPAFMCMAYVNIMNTFFCNTTIYSRSQLLIAMQAALLFVLLLFMVKYLGVEGVVISYITSFLMVAFFTYLTFLKNKDSIEKL